MKRMPRKRVLLIEDDSDYEQLIRAVLVACGDMFEVKSAAGLAAGLALIQQYSPELIMVDLNLSDSSGYETFLRVKERAAGNPIIVLTGLDDDQMAIRAVGDGAQDYLVKSQIQPKHIARCVNMAISRQKRQDVSKAGESLAPATVLSFIGSKGGVGTSTIAVNLAALLAHSGLETIVIELQQGRPATLSLYSTADRSRGLNSLLTKPADAIGSSDVQACLVEALSGLHMLYPTASTGTWRVLGADHVHAIIAAARRLCRFVVLDLPARIDDGIAAALQVCDSVTMIVDREASAVHCGAAFLGQLRSAMPRSKEVHLVVVDRTILDAPLRIEDLTTQLKLHPLVFIPATGARIALSQAARTPLVLLYPQERFGLAHLELAERLLPPAASGSHLSKYADLLLSGKPSWNTIPETTYS